MSIRCCHFQDFLHSQIFFFNRNNWSRAESLVAEDNNFKKKLMKTISCLCLVIITIIGLFNSLSTVAMNRDQIAAVIMGCTTVHDLARSKPVTRPDGTIISYGVTKGGKPWLVGPRDLLGTSMAPEMTLKGETCFLYYYRISDVMNKIHLLYDEAEARLQSSSSGSGSFTGIWRLFHHVLVKKDSKERNSYAIYSHFSGILPRWQNTGFWIC